MTNRRLKSLVSLALCAALPPALPLAEERPPAAANVIQKVGVSDAPGGVELEIRGSRAPSYTVFRLQEPPRLVVDLAGADVSAVSSPISVHKGGVAEVSTAQYHDDKASVGRIIVALEGSPRYEVTPRGDAVVVKVSGAAATATTASTAGAASGSTPAATSAPAAVSTPTATATATQTAISKPAVASPASSDVLSRRLDEVAVAKPATAIRGAKARSGGIALALDGEVARMEILELSNPPRLAVDLYGISRAPHAPVPLSGAFRQARFGRDTGKVRVVLDAAGELPHCAVSRVSGGISILPMTARAQARPEPSSRVEAVGVAAGSDAPVMTTVSSAPERTAVTDARAAGFTGEAASYAISSAPQRREYTGRRITLDFHDIDVRNLLRLIADVSKKNIVVADDVNGKVTVSLRNVPWDQALDLVLKSKGLDKEEMGNVIRVAKVEDIAKEAEARAAAAKARAPLLPLKVRLIPVNFARATEIASRVKDVLSDRGTVSTDERTNVLIVKDTEEALARAEGLVRNLDTEVPQVRIESRIIEASSNFNKQIGVQWGGNANFSPATGNPTGLFFPNVVNTTGASDNSASTGISGSPNYAVSLPAPVGQGSGGAIGFTFGSASGAFNLNLRLSALENQGVVKTISAPSVSTIDNREAIIGQGLSIPFSQVSASGVNTVFVEAKLELKVTPHISADGSILMKIKVTNNAPNPQLTGANGQPSISKREAETEALVKDGDTTVIGGIYTRQMANKMSGVPLLSKIPILGFFFRTKSEQDDHTELLIFITPRILNRQAASAVATGAQP